MCRGKEIMQAFQNSFEYRLIYIFRINDNAHKNILKIGETSIATELNHTELNPNCNVLKNAAKKRIDEYTKTAGISYELLHTELAIKTVSKNGYTYLQAFRDNDVHVVLERSNIKRHKFEEKNKGREWFITDLETAKNAIQAVKDGRDSLKTTEVTQKRSPIIFRPEQKEAIEKTKKTFKKSNVMLWNAKMRFGKTLTALQVAKEMEFAKTIILTHRPVVNDSWFEDFGKIFYDKIDYIYGSKSKGETIKSLSSTGKKFVYFASLQDLRGSQAVGGKYDKNDEIFSIAWDFIVIDEAHEGTRTELGQAVIDYLQQNNTNVKTLQLSGTPFNLMHQYKEDEIYTWDYVMEQRAKTSWYSSHFGDSNPYANLPKMEIYTYDLKDNINFVDTEDNAFNFKEFFRTWTGNIQKDLKAKPENATVGDFVHEKDVLSFLNLLCQENAENNYPFSTKKYQDYFRHTLWMLPGVKEAKALSQLLQKHPVFSQFKIVNVAGNGDEDEESKDALQKVRNAIGKNPEESYTITLSCGRLTTGVTVPEWTAVFMLAGSYATAASAYLQTIFRVQSPANINGKIKETCYVFDFAPDRTLKMIAEFTQLSTKAGNTSSDKKLIGEFLNFCPVIGMQGSAMTKYDVDTMLQQLKQAYTDKVVKNGFDDHHIYNDNLLKLDGIELKMFENLKKIVGASKQTKKANEIDINQQGLTNEQYETLQNIEKKPPKQRTAEEIALLEERKKHREQAEKARSILRGISIRIPLLIYGADIDFEEEIYPENFTALIKDENSWQEFMPKGVTKDMFNQIAKYYDRDIFVAAGKKIRRQVKAADELPPTERVQKIAEIFSTFKNPDKETVLTPWRVVNMHMGHCLGGYSFFDEEYKNTIDEPRLINYGAVTTDTVANAKAEILEINSKTGLYPLYVAYSIYRKRLQQEATELSIETQYELWNKTIAENIYVICKTDMAKAITKRTLLGFRNGKINAHAFEDLNMQVKEKPEKLIEKITKGSFWKKESTITMKFDAIVGNPPYQEMDDSANSYAMPIYNKFVDVAKKLKANYISMIMPSRWMTGGKGLDEFLATMLLDKHLITLYDYINAKDIFDSVDIKGGVCYFLRNNNLEDMCDIHTFTVDGEFISKRYLNEGESIYIRDSRILNIKNKIYNKKNSQTIDKIMSNCNPYGLKTDVFANQEKYKLPKFSDNVILDGYKILGLNEKQKRIWKYISKDYPLPRQSNMLNKYKVFIAEAYGCGAIGEVPSTPVLSTPGELCTATFLQMGPFETQLEAENLIRYIKTKFFRTLVGILKQTQHTTARVYRFVPMQDFTENSDIDWTASIPEIDAQLYRKYNLTESEITFIETTIKPME